jgi:hypothetical protein
MPLARERRERQGSICTRFPGVSFLFPYPQPALRSLRSWVSFDKARLRGSWGARGGTGWGFPEGRRLNLWVLYTRTRHVPTHKSVPDLFPAGRGRFLGYQRI